jgi:Zn-finger nucleic acid-binding protein
VQCLNCEAEMATETLASRQGEVVFETCLVCGGCWFDVGELDAVVAPLSAAVERLSRQPRRENAGPPRRCPRCSDGPLTTVFLLDWVPIALDRCGHCRGFWLDGGELDAIRRELRALRPGRADDLDRQGGDDLAVPNWYVEFLKALAQHR